MKIVIKKKNISKVQIQQNSIALVCICGGKSGGRINNPLMSTLQPISSPQKQEKNWLLMEESQPEVAFVRSSRWTWWNNKGKEVP